MSKKSPHKRNAGFLVIIDGLAWLCCLPVALFFALYFRHIVRELA